MTPRLYCPFANGTAAKRLRVGPLSQRADRALHALTHPRGRPVLVALLIDREDLFAKGRSRDPLRRALWTP
jgi:hypothetical protein